MSSTLPPRAHLISTYRTLLRSGLRAVKYATPARYFVRDKLRAAFAAPKSGELNPYDQIAIDNTKHFLENAAATKGLEHRIVRNMCSVQGFRQMTHNKRKVGNDPYEQAHAIHFYDEYEATIQLLNDSMRLALR